jgi:hypothetical protein
MSETKEWTLMFYSRPTTPGKHTGGELSQAAQKLGQMVLSPVAGELNKRRVIVLADGALHYIPSLALTVQPRPNDASNPGERIPLLASHEIVYGAFGLSAGLCPQRRLAS